MRASSFLAASAVFAFVGSACSDDSAAGGSSAGGASAGGGGAAGTGGSPEVGGMGGATNDGGGGGGGDPRTMKRVFVSSTTFDGNLGGLVGGDAECQALADSAALGGTWMAWLSETTGASPSTRFTQFAEPYVLVGGAQIAADWAALIDGSIEVPIDRDETGAQISGEIAEVWTGTAADAQAVSPCCANWTTTQSPASYGVTDAIDASWTGAAGQGCNAAAHLYCFEQ